MIKVLNDDYGLSLRQFMQPLNHQNHNPDN